MPTDSPPPPKAGGVVGDQSKGPLRGAGGRLCLPRRPGYRGGRGGGWGRGRAGRVPVRRCVDLWLLYFAPPEKRRASPVARGVCARWRAEPFAPVNPIPLHRPRPAPTERPAGGAA